MRPSPHERLEILKLEMGLIQGTLDKYDDLIFRNRNWFITIWAGAVGLAFTQSSTVIAWLAVGLSIAFWVIEGFMRHQYWYKYVVRYRAISKWLNDSSDEEIAVYDLANQYGVQPAQSEWIGRAFFKKEPALVYSLMAFGAGIVAFLV